MAERRPRVVIVPPGGAGLKYALQQISTPSSFVTALEDSALHTAKQMLVEHPVEELIPFASCIGRIAAMCGDTGLPRLTGPQAIHLIQRAAAIQNLDSPLRAASYSYGLAKNLAKALTEIRYHKITADDLIQAADLIDNQITAGRLRDLAELIPNYEQFCHDNGREFASERAEFCLAQTEKRHFTIKHLVVILTGEPSPIYNDWLKWLAMQGVQVDCLIAAWPNQQGAFVRELAWAEELGDIEDWTLRATQNEKWSENLFQPGRAKLSNSPVTVNLLTMGDTLTECEWIIREIQYLLQDNVPANKIGIFIRGSGDHIPLLAIAAERLGLPLSGTHSTPLHANGFVAVALELLKSLASNDVRTLRFALANSYFQVPAQDFEKLLTSLTALQAQHEDPWSEFALVITENLDYAWLHHLVEWREQAISSPKTLSVWSQFLHTLWANTPILDHALLGPPESKTRDSQAWTLMQRTIRDAALSTDRKTTFTFAEFLSLATMLWEEEQIIWHDQESNVKLCTNPNQLVGFDHLFCLNMLEGTLPKRRRQDAVLDDTDRRLLFEALPDHPPLPLSTKISSEERSLFITLCSAAQKSLTFSHAETGEDRDNIATFYLDELEELLPVRKHTYKRSELTPPAEKCKNWPDRTLQAALAGERDSFELPRLQEETTRDMVRPDLREPIPVRELAQAAACPFRASMSHRVEFKAPDSSLPIRILRSLPRKAQLIKQPTATAAKGTLIGLAASELEDHLHHLDNWEQALYHDAIIRIIEGWVDREFLAREMLNLHEFKLQTNYSSQQGETRAILKGDPPIKLQYNLDGLYEKDNLRIGFLYGAYLPWNLYDAQKDIESSLWATLLLMTLGKPGGETCLMVDTLEGDRHLVTKTKDRSFLTRGMLGAGITHTSLTPRDEDDRVSGILPRLQIEIAQARARLSKAEAVPIAGDHCTRCTLGDLCRSHNQFGESRSLFEDI